MMKGVLRATVFILIFALLIFAVLLAVPDEFGKSYQRALVRQYDYFKSIEGNKIVLIGGSSLSFGLDIDIMEELADMPCAVLGNHAAYGLPFLLEMSKKNLGNGDVVVIEFENSPTDRTDGAELLLTGIGKRYDIHKFFPKEIRKSLVKAVPYYVQSNLKYFRLGEPYDPEIPYFLEAYDEHGNMTLNRPEPWLTEAYIDHRDGDDEELQFQDYYSMMRNLNYDLFNYINEYTDYCASIGAKVFITLQPVYDDAVPDYCTDDVLAEYDSILSEHLKAPLVTTSKENVLPREYFFDSYLHLNTPGAELRTKMLYEDLKEYL